MFPVRFRDCWQTASNHPLSSMNDTLQSTLILGSGGSIPAADGGLSDSRVEVHHHGLWQAKLLQLPQEVHSLWGLLDRELMFGSHFMS